MAAGLRRRGLDVMTTQEAGRCATGDRDQLRFAADAGRVLCTQDHHFLVLHSDGVGHAGLAYVKQGTPIGVIIRGLVLVHDALEPDDMRNQVEYL